MQIIPVPSVQKLFPANVTLNSSGEQIDRGKRKENKREEDKRGNGETERKRNTERGEKEVEGHRGFILE